MPSPQTGEPLELFISLYNRASSATLTEEYFVTINAQGVFDSMERMGGALRVIYKVRGVPPSFPPLRKRPTVVLASLFTEIGEHCPMASWDQCGCSHRDCLPLSTRTSRCASLRRASTSSSACCGEASLYPHNWATPQERRGPLVP